MKIEMYGAGSVLQSMYTPAVRESILPELAGKKASSGKSSSTSSKPSFLEKELEKLISENGVHSDKKAMLAQIYKFLNSAQSVYNSDGSENIGQVLAHLVVMQEMVNDIKLNKQAYDGAVNRMESKNTGSDVALTSSGQVYVYDGTKVTTMDVGDYKKNKEDYQLLNNSTLLNLRNADINLAGRIDILHDISNSVGMEDIMETIEQAIVAFGEKSTTTQTMKMPGTVQRGMEGLYKVLTKYDVNMENNKAILGAINYLKNTRLNTNARNTLEVMATLQDTTADQLLFDALLHHTGYTYTEDLEGSKSGKGSSGSGSGGEKLDYQVSFGETVIMDYGKPETTDLIFGTSIKYTVPGHWYNTINNAKDKTLPLTQTLGEVFENLQAQGIISSHKPIYYGNMHLNNISAAASDLLVDNSKGAKTVYLPTDAAGNISYSLINQMQAVQHEIEMKKLTDTAVIKALWERAGFEYDSETGLGKPRGYKLTPFWVQEAYTTERTDTFKDPAGFTGSVLNGNPTVQKVDDSIIERMVDAYNRQADKNSKISMSAGWFTDSYKGLILIPLNVDIKEAMIAAKNGYMPKPNIAEVAATQQAVGYGGRPVEAKSADALNE